MPTVLMVDDELGFLLWLGTVFGEAGYRAVPAKTVSDAARMARVFPPDVLLINPELLGAGKLISTLRAHNPNLKVIALAEPAEQLENVIAIRKPIEITAKTGDQWLNTIESVLGERKVRQGGSSFI